MTTIAVSRSLKTMACDLQFTHASGTKMKGRSKILPLFEDVCEPMFNCREALLGFAGSSNVIGDVVSWFTDISQSPPRVRDTDMILLTSNGKIFLATNLRNWIEVNEKHFAIGSGAPFAIGALESGSTTLEAVKIASKHDAFTGMGFQEFDL